MKHLLSIADLSRSDIERVMTVAESFAEVVGARHQEGADPARPHRREPLLRGQHPHQLVVRAGRQAALRGRRQHPLDGLERRQGRVAARHDRDAVRLRPGRDRDPGALGRARPDLVARQTVGVGRERGRRQARAPEPGAARRLHAAPPDGLARRAADLDRRRRPAQPRRALQRPRLHAHGRAA